MTTETIHQHDGKRSRPAALYALFGGLALALMVFSARSAAAVSQPAESPAGTNASYLPFVSHNFNAPNVFGVEMEMISPIYRLDLVEQAGAYWVRVNALAWDLVEPVQGGGYQWPAVASLELELANAAPNGLHSILVVGSTPAWAQLVPGYSCGPMKQMFFDEFAAFLSAAVKRYSVAPYYITHYEIWNEPDIDPSLVNPSDPYGCWGDEDDPYYGGGFYGLMLKAVYPAFKAANPNAQLIVGGLLLDCDPNNPPIGRTCVESKFLEGILQAGAKDSFDIVAFHAYDHFNWNFNTYGNTNWNSGRFNNEPAGVLQPVLIKKAAFLRGVLNAYGASGKPMIATEIALICGGPTDPPGQPGCDAFDDSDLEQMKSAYVAQGYAASMAEGLPGSIWLAMYGWRNSGLLYSNYQPRPAYFALDFAQEQLEGAKYTGKIASIPLVTGYVFDPYGPNSLWLAWTTDGITRTVNLPSVPLQILDVYGNDVPVSGTSVTLTFSPLYIRMP